MNLRSFVETVFIQSLRIYGNSIAMCPTIVFALDWEKRILPCRGSYTGVGEGDSLIMGDRVFAYKSFRFIYNIYENIYHSMLGSFGRYVMQENQ